MPVYTYEALYLGNFPDADTDEASFTAETPGVFLGSFGSSGDPLKDHEVDINYDDSNDDGAVDTNNMGFDAIGYDLGGGMTAAQIDSLATVDLTVFYTDGSSATFTDAVMFQDINGNLFLVNSGWAGDNLNGSAGIESITSSSPDTNYNGLFHTPLQDFVCFLRGTRIQTPGGPRPVETLRVGDLVVTRDHGTQPVRWVGASCVMPSARTMPIKLARGSLGQDIPTQDLYVSRHHRVLLASPVAERMFEAREVLAPARLLSGTPGIVATMPAADAIAYHHLLFDRHELVLANGAWSESLLVGPNAIDLMGPSARAELATLFPGLLRAKTVAAARPIASGRRTRRLLMRLARNQRPLFEPPRVAMPG